MDFTNLGRPPFSQKNLEPIRVPRSVRWGLFVHRLRLSKAEEMRGRGNYSSPLKVSSSDLFTRRPDFGSSSIARCSGRVINS